MNKNPLYIYVDGADWEAYGKETLLNQFKLKVLYLVGGVNESVVPGTYIFRVWLSRKGWMVSLLPAE